MDALTMTPLDEAIARAERLLRRLPEQLQHIHSTIQPSGVMRMDPNAGGKSRRKGELGYAPLSTGAVDACDLVYKTLAEWTIVWAETQSIRPPRIDAWWTRGAVEPDVAGLPGNVTSRGVYELTALLEAFLRGQHGRMQHHVLFPEYLDEIAALAKTVAPWPLEETGPRRPHFRPCPLCDAFSVTAEQYGADVSDMHAVCNRCGHTFKELTP